MSREFRNSIRQVHRDFNDLLRKMVKNNDFSEDNERCALDVIQKITDSHIKKVDELPKSKDDELLQR